MRYLQAKRCVYTYASWIERAQRFKLFAMASSSRISSSEDAFRAILACLRDAKDETIGQKQASWESQVTLLFPSGALATVKFFRWLTLCRE